MAGADRLFADPRQAASCGGSGRGAREIACAAPAALDRSTARALVDAGYMPLSRYVELFEGAEPQFGEGEV